LLVFKKLALLLLLLKYPGIAVLGLSGRRGDAVVVLDVV